ncbi:DUF2628 domain-containing protein [Elioraea sp.]|uniref:DUF2628 domain-containing protein n=1 Tax=Elioraea sp. TaxID=2185103 RepID=UPI0021DDABE5|nr:DUF2628 domain-containing protein [Elioraea sp.]GIX09335.1 MAG: hypothetical protein KatS3mg116_1045 [Elioraea sp.]
MRIWTVHVRPGHETILVREGFAWLAFLFPVLWFLAHRMWLVVVLYLAGATILGAAMRDLPEALIALAGLAVQLLIGFHARDLRRWTLARRGWRLLGVVAARGGEDAALVRLYAGRPDLLAWGSARA